ncbi:MAG: hypothetical protein K2P51_09045 [Rhabdochlamydiaceae bacterium]|nr:hypothetical protein [Rhabdochlamydiaceae bacterium]
MKQKERQKLCVNCDGRIPLEAIVCPYCAAEATPQASVQEAEYRKQQSFNDSLAALYPPPYAAKNTESSRKEEYKSAAPMKQADPFKDVSEKRFSSVSGLGIPSIPAHEQEEAHAVDEKSSFWPLLFLSVGANLLMLGFLQLFFSDNGMLKLEWDSSYWYVYCLAAAPLVLLGYKKANLLK